MGSRSWKESVCLRLATWRSADRSRISRVIGGRGLAALIIGGVLSAGGLGEAFDALRFFAKDDLDVVHSVRRQGSHAAVAAAPEDGPAAPSLFNLSQLLPRETESRRMSFFGRGWPSGPAVSPGVPRAKRDVFYEEMARINAAIRRDFFANAMPYGEIIHEKAQKYDVDPALVAAVIEQESDFIRTARSEVGATGLMQLMPGTGRLMGAKNLYDAEQNVDAGVKYIKYLQARFHGNMKQTLAAYNAGEGNVKRYGGVPPFQETQTYVRRVLRNYRRRTDELRHFTSVHAGGAGLDADGSLTLR